MALKVSHMTVYVTDQERAKRFYTEQLGFEERVDQDMGGGMRWVTVGPPDQPDLEITLMVPAPPLFDEETAGQVRALLDKGVLGVGALRTEDARATVASFHDKDVPVVQEPAERPYGIEAVIRDDSGNWWSVTQPPGG